MKATHKQSLLAAVLIGVLAFLRRDRRACGRQLTRHRLHSDRQPGLRTAEMIFDQQVYALVIAAS